ncbi:MAG: antibiotic biosynthesis monooxygenase [Kangiellaceae bacterium]|nr:antibiotic biosynthesis monooxygenase [Kangiellaceae bacterium]
MKIDENTNWYQASLGWLISIAATLLLSYSAKILAEGIEIRSEQLSKLNSFAIYSKNSRPDVALQLIPTVVSEVINKEVNNMSTLVIVELSSRKNLEKEMLAFFADRLAETRESSGNTGVTLHRDGSDSRKFILIEQWRSKSHYEQYHKWRAERGDLVALSKFLTEAPTRRYFKNLVLWPSA